MSFFKKAKGLFKKKLPDHFCIAPFVQMDLHEQGRVNACCKAKDKLGDWSDKKISEIWNDQPMQRLRKQFFSGEKPRGCSTCWLEEEKGLVSRRLNYNETLSDEVKKIEDELHSKGKVSSERPLRFRSLDVGFGAQCSLRCRMCGPSSSSKWLSTAMGNKDVYRYFADIGELNPQVVDTGFKDFLTESLFKDFCKNVVPNVGDLMISGGEPLNSENHFRMFHEELTDSQLRSMKVTLTTNAQSTAFKGVSLIPRWINLKRFVYRISIDGGENTYSYVRSGGDYQKVIESARLVRKAFPYEEGRLQMVSAIAVSLYNITRLGELIDFAVREGTFLHFNWVHYPRFLSIQNLPTDLVQESTYKLESKLKDISKDSYWAQNPLWRQPLRFDYDFEIYKVNFRRMTGSTPSETISYGRYAKERFREQIEQVLVALRGVNDKEKLPDEFQGHIRLLDSVNDTDFLSVFSEFKPYLGHDFQSKT